MELLPPAFLNIPRIDYKRDMKIREKHLAVKELMILLEKKRAATWKAVAKGLNRPRRKGREVNLFDLEGVAGKEAILVPGTVLGEGEITKPVTIAALRFSGKAREKIEKRGGTVLTISEMVEKHPTGKGIRIVG